MIMKKKSIIPGISSFKLAVHYISAPQNYLNEFASTYRHYSAMTNLHYTFLAITKPKLHKKLGSGSDNIFFNEQLEQLVEASWLMLQGDMDLNTGRIPFDIPNDSLLFRQFLFAKHDDKFPWYTMPRHLDDAEFRIPMIAIREFFKTNSLNNWKYLLNLILHTVLSKFQTDGFPSEDGNLYHLHISFAKLLEATHLIHVRQQPYYLQEIKLFENEAKDYPADSVVPKTAIKNGDEGEAGTRSTEVSGTGIS